jgi:hypothetical protein
MTRTPDGIHRPLAVACGCETAAAGAVARVIGGQDSSVSWFQSVTKGISRPEAHRGS